MMFNKSAADLFTMLNHRLRMSAQLLIIVLSSSSAQISLWKGNELLWEEAAAYENDVSLEAFLRSSLLAHDVEENIAALMLLDEGLLATERITLPKLSVAQLRKALAWEVAQVFSLPAGTYSYCYKLLEKAGAAAHQSAQESEAQQMVQIFVLAHARQTFYMELGKKLLLKLQEPGVIDEEMEAAASKGTLAGDVADSLQAVGAGRVAAHAAQKWFAGKELLHFPPLPTKVDWKRHGRTAVTHFPRIACVCVLAAFLFVCGSFVARYFVASELQEVQQRVERYALWSERRKESVQLEKRLAQLQKQAEQRKSAAVVSKELEAWGRLQLNDVYLTELEYKTLTLQGRQQMVIKARGVAKEAQAVEQLVEVLQRTARYSSVNMLESKATSAGVAFSLELVATGGKK